MRNNRIKIGIFIFAVLFVIAACKRKELSSLEGNMNENITLNKIDARSIDAYSFGECIGKTADSLRSWVHKFGAGGSKFGESGAAMDAYGDIMMSGFDCANQQGGGLTTPVAVPAFVPPPITEEKSIGNINEFLIFLHATNLCDESSVTSVKSKIAPINVIIKRTVDDLGSSYYASSMSVGERIFKILSHFNSNDDYLLQDDGFTIIYISTVAQLGFHIPEIVAQKLMEKDPLFQGIPGPNGELAQLYKWNGFIIDSSDINLQNYCAPPSTQLLLPSPLPTYIFYNTQIPHWSYVTPGGETSIVLNTSNNKYYTNDIFTNFVPDGYYKHPNDNNSNKLYHIVNGVVTEIVQSITDPNIPIEGP